MFYNLFQVACSVTLESHRRSTTMTSAAEYVRCRRNLLKIFDEQIERSQPDTTTDRLTGFTRDHYYHIKTYADFAVVEEQFLGRH